MPLGLGIVEVLRAIPPRIEVTGHGPTVRITAGSFEAALDYARERFDAPGVLGCDVRHRFWPRVTLTVATDPELAGSAPPLEEVRAQAERQAAALAQHRRPAHRAGAGARRVTLPAHVGADPEQVPGPGFSTLEEIFAGQERQRQERARIPDQRRSSTG